MPKLIERDAAINMMYTVCGRYNILKDDIIEYFNNEYKGKEQFDVEELKIIASNLTGKIKPGRTKDVKVNKSFFTPYNRRGGKRGEISKNDEDIEK